MPRAVTEWVGKTPDAKVPPRVRLRIFEREGGKCHLSGRKIAPGELWDLDHKVALVNGGEHRERNLFPALRDKHREKTKADVAEKAVIAARAKSHVIPRDPDAKPKLQGRQFDKKPKPEKIDISTLPRDGIARQYGVK